MSVEALTADELANRPQPRRLERWLSKRVQADESGLALIWMSLFLMVLLGFAALAVDIGHGYFVAQEAQNAADAAALAGTIYMPGDLTAAQTAAQSVAAKNGFTSANSTVSATPGTKPTQLMVTVTQNVRTWFARAIGFPTMTITRSATADYLKPLSMGSPSNQFGNDPDAVKSWPVSNPPPPTYPNFWANIAGGNSVKQNGDAYAANNCDIPTDGCSGIGPKLNLDYNPKGYYYAVDFTAGATVNLQAFDPAFVEVGDFCTDGSANLAGAAALTNVPNYPEGATNTADIARRYHPVTNQGNQADPGYQYCTGDQIFNHGGTTGPAPTTTFTVLKAAIPGYTSTAQPVPGCSPITYPGFTGDLASALGSGVTPPGAPGALASYFRQWVTLCQVTGQPGDEYFIEVTTDAASQGHNRFALRGVTTSGSAAPVDLAANSYMGVYANVGTQLTQFYLTRVPSAAAGHTLDLSFFDIGDAPAGSIGTLTVVPPPDSNVGSSFAGCDWTGNSSSGAVGYALNTPGAPWGSLSPITGCQITGVNNNSANWNAQWSTVTVPIPANYTCNDASAQGCWIKLNYQFTGGINDTTSWTAVIEGDPVRIVK